MNRRLVSSILGILLALALAGILLLVEGYNPLRTYAALFQYSVFDVFTLASTLKNSVPLILTGLSASIAFGSGVDNLGQPGQFLLGALFATLGGLYIDLPPYITLPILVLLALLGGALWSLLAALSSTLFGMNEFIVTLMLNMIADFLTAWAITYPFMDPEAYSPMTPRILEAARMIEFGKFNTSSLFIPALVMISWFILQRTKTGYEWRMMGQNFLFARIGGTQPEKNFIRVMLFSGALAGLAGGLLVMAGPHRFLKGLGGNYAWDGVMIAVVAANNLIATMFYGFFIGALQTGAIGMELITDVPREFTLMVQAIMLLVVVASREYFNLALERIRVRRQTRERQT